MEPMDDIEFRRLQNDIAATADTTRKQTAYVGEAMQIMREQEEQRRSGQGERTRESQEKVLFRLREAIRNT